MAEFGPNEEGENQTESNQNSQQSNEKELPKLNHYNKGTIQTLESSNSPSQAENKLPKLIRNNHSNKNDQNQSDSFSPTDRKLAPRSPRRHKEGSSNYNPRIFYTPPDNYKSIKSNKALMANEATKSPIKLNLTLKDIGMEGFDSTTPDKK